MAGKTGGKTASVKKTPTTKAASTRTAAKKTTAGASRKASTGTGRSASKSNARTPAAKRIAGASARTKADAAPAAQQAATNPAAVKTTTKAARMPADNAFDSAPTGLPAAVATLDQGGVPVDLPNPVSSNAAPSHDRFIDDRARQVAQERHFAASGVKTIHAHISSRDRRKQGRRDDRDS